MHAVFLYYGLKCGLDFGIVNPSAKITYNDIPEAQLPIIEDVILNRKKGASEQLIELADKLKADDDSKKSQGLSATPTSQTQDEWRTLPLDKRLIYALRKGISDYLQDDLKEALAEYPHAVNIIEGPLMNGMNEVGKLFGAGKMFLPQVVKTARTMKQAVAILQPYIESERTDHSAKAGKVLLATVKGDVHDIGKNIVAVIMACNNYDVIDMGVMVPAEQIVKKALDEKVNIIGLSGLITPSLDEMVNVAKQLRQAGLNIPIMIGGATTSQLHVALRIAPVYGGPVVWMRDASQNPIIASRLLNKKEEPKLEQELDRKYASLRENYKKEQERLLSLDDARNNKLNLFN
jgi:5-methyltetrahydrofolate--homocysteine methyltransferase